MYGVSIHSICEMRDARGLRCVDAKRLQPGVYMNEHELTWICFVKGGALRDAAVASAITTWL